MKDGFEILLDKLELEAWLSLERHSPDDRYRKGYRWKAFMHMVENRQIMIPDNRRQQLTAYIDSSNWHEAFDLAEHVDESLEVFRITPPSQDVIDVPVLICGQCKQPIGMDRICYRCDYKH